MILDKIDELLKEVQTLSAKNAEEVEQLRLFDARAVHHRYRH